MKKNRGIDPLEFKNLKDSRRKLEFLANFASLAPSSHNTQPWFFKIQANSITIFADISRKLAVADPDGRQLSITLGTLIESLLIVSRSYGLGYSVKISDHYQDQNGLCTVTYSNLESAEIDLETLKAVISRHNSRLPFENRALSAEALEKIIQLVEPGINLVLVSDEAKKEELKQDLLNSVEEAFKDKAFRKELYPWLKPSIGNHEEGLVGKNLGMPFLASLIFPTITRFFDISKLQVKIHTRMLNNVPVFGVLCGQDTISDWIKVGQSLFRIAIESEKSGISIGIMQASVENPVNRLKLQSYINSQLKPQLFFRMGYCGLMHHHSPRRPIEKIIIK